jgi:hypothetical protein
MTNVPCFRVAAVELYERSVRLRIPFRFGRATVLRAPQAFIRARIAFADGTSATGAAAELMIPKWFDKSPQRSDADNIAELRRSLAAAAEAYTAEATPRTAFGHCAANYGPLLRGVVGGSVTSLAACFGPALLDRAVLDALCRRRRVSFYAAMKVNLPGIDVDALTPDLHGFDMDAFLSALAPRGRIAVRHTVGLLDPLTDEDVEVRVGDDLPQTLLEVIAAYRPCYFKVKLSGEPTGDLERLRRIAAVLDRPARAYRITLDGNEQFRDLGSIVSLWQALAADDALARFAERVLWIEQPLPRELAEHLSIGTLARVKPVVIDESDGTLEAFPAARELGYTGVSSKSCKGLYKSLLNAARCALWNAAGRATSYFVCGEDLTTQAGLAVQQDLALVNLLGITHVERNGHHYAGSFAAQGAGESEQRRFLVEHPGLYEENRGEVRLAIRDGMLALASLDAAGFASRAEPDWATLEPLGVALATTN